MKIFLCITTNKILSKQRIIDLLYILYPCMKPIEHKYVHEANSVSNQLKNYFVQNNEWSEPMYGSYS